MQCSVVWRASVQTMPQPSKKQNHQGNPSDLGELRDLFFDAGEGTIEEARGSAQQQVPYLAPTGLRQQTGSLVYEGLHVALHTYVVSPMVGDQHNQQANRGGGGGGGALLERRGEGYLWDAAT